MHAIIYDRASTKMQKDNYSRVNAREVGIRIAEQNGFTWEYVKEIGSGTTLTGRPKIMKILDRIAAGEVQIIIVQDLDRLARPEDAIVYKTIRDVIMEYNVIIYTHSARVNLNNDDDDFVADINMAVSKKERRRILKRMKRSMKAKADQGRFTGGGVALGYKVIHLDRDSDLAVDESEAETVKAAFNILQATGGNMGAAAKQMNKLGHRGKKGQLFAPHTIRLLANRRLYIGIFETGYTDKITHRPDLQIISGQQFDRVQSLIKSRAGKSKDMGRRGRYVFTGFVACGACGGPMVAAKQVRTGAIAYQCATQRAHGTAACPGNKAYSEHLILPPIVEFLAGFIRNQIDFNAALDSAAAQYGKTVTEEAIEASISGEIASVQAGKERLIEAISLGILTNQEAAAKLAELRAQEARLIAELSGIAEKVEIMAEWQKALDALKKQDITGRLYELAELNPASFRQLLSLVFEPNSLRVRTYRQGRKWVGELISYKLTEAMQKETGNLIISIGNKKRVVL
jgi:DNA invertase Pin-like site-specific DNA recombinase